MLATDPKRHRIRATLKVWGAGPGLSGTSYIEFVPTPDGWEVFGGGTATAGREQLAVLPFEAGWRARVAFLVHHATPAHEDHGVDDVRVTGATGTEARLLATAWSGPAGAAAVATLTEFSDDELDAILWGGASAAQESIEALQRLGDDLGDAQILALVRQEIQGGPFTWGSLLESARAAGQDDEARRASLRQRREVALEPFACRIGAMLSNWWRSNGGASSSVTQMMMSARKEAIRRFCEDHALAHGLLPTGTHEVAFTAFGREMSVTVDFDELVVE